MILDKVLILKGLGGITALGGSALAVYFVVSPSNNDSSKELLEKAGLKCTFNGNECEIISLENGKKINIKHDTTKEEEKTFTISTPSTAKIKVQKNVAASEGYNQNLKLTIEGGDINLTTTGSGSPTITKLEEFETYEIVKDGEKWYLTRKTDALTGKSKALGLPTEDSTCKLPATGSTTCSLNTDKLKAIKFDGKGEGEITIENNETPSITLTITKVENSDSNFSTYGYKFAFATNKDITISSSNKIMKNTNTEFKIKATTAEGSAKTLFLEKVWTVTKLAEKVGLSCTVSDTKECTLPTNKSINVAFSSSDKSTTTIQEADKDKKIKYEEDAAGHNQGFKFYIDSNGQEISLTSGSETKKIEKKSDSGSPSYEIKEIDGQWYLTKKETTTGG